MHPRAFIEHHVRQILSEGGYSCEAVHLAAQEALKYYDTTPTFKKGEVFPACLNAAKKVAKLVQKKQQRQRAATPSKGATHG